MHFRQYDRDNTEHGRTYYQASEVDTVVQELERKVALYEKLRKLNPRQFKELYAKNIAGHGPFDDLVSALRT